MTRKITKLNGEEYSVVKDSKSDTGDKKVSYYGRNVYGFKYTGSAFTTALSKFVEYRGDLKPTRRTLAVSASNTRKHLGYLVQFKNN